MTDAPDQQLMAICLARTPQSTATLLQLSRSITAALKDRSDILERWLDQQIGSLAELRPMPEAAWGLSTEPTPETAAALAPLVQEAAWFGANQRAIVALPLLAASLPECRFLVLVESPESAMAGWLSDTQLTLDVADRHLADWRRAAQLLLDSLPALRDRITCLSLDDLVSQTSVALDSHGLSFRVATSPTASLERAGSLLSTMLRGWIAGDESEVLHGRILAACEDLTALGDTPLAARERLRHAARAESLSLLRDAQAAHTELCARSPPGEHRDQPATLLDGAKALGQVASLRQDNDLLRIFLQQMQEELEHLHRNSHRRIQSPVSSSPAPAPVAPRSLTPPVSQDVQLLQQAMSLPHRHMEFSIPGRWGNHGESKLAGRIVEHHGRPGLLLFEQGQPILERWVPSGAESGRTFMLVIPEDPAGAKVIRDAPAPDWRVFMEVVRRVRQALQSHVSEITAPYWYGVTSRLLNLLTSDTARLRWGPPVAVLPPDPEEARGLQLQISELSLGSQFVKQVHLIWRVTSQGASVELLHQPSRGHPWLASWPVTPEGEVAARWMLPVGPQLATLDKRRAWSQLSPGDQAWLVSVLQALPELTRNALTRDGAATPLTAEDAARLSRLGAEAQQHLRQLRVRAWVRRIVRPGRNR